MAARANHQGMLELSRAARVDAFSVGSGSLDVFPSNGPYAASTYIRAGQPVYQNQVARPIAVHAGELVMVLVKNGPVTVRAQLQSQSTAAVGETATMINPGSGRPILVTVTGPRAAELVMQ
jgi:flagella basal body P-ring formation protein FlgA